MRTPNAGFRLQKSWLDMTISFLVDPSAGSPTETLLRLLLPLNDAV